MSTNVLANRPGAGGPGRARPSGRPGRIRLLALAGAVTGLLVAVDVAAVACRGVVLAGRMPGAGARLEIARCEPAGACDPGAPATSAVAGRDGAFDCGDLTPGDYRITTRLGHRHEQGADLRLVEGRAAVLEIQLDPLAAVDAPAPFRLMHERLGVREMGRFDRPLADLGAPPLCAVPLSDGETSMRFLWLRSFHPHVLVHVRFLGDGRVLGTYTEREQYPRASAPSEIRIDIGASTVLGRSDDPAARRPNVEYFHGVRDRLSAQLRAAPGAEAQPPGHDGAVWTVELRRADDCHVASRWSPREGDAVRAVGLVLLKLAGRKYFPDEVY